MPTVPVHNLRLLESRNTLKDSVLPQKYVLYGNQAKLDGYLRAADFFLEAARQELQHG